MMVLLELATLSELSFSTKLPLFTPALSADEPTLSNSRASSSPQLQYVLLLYSVCAQSLCLEARVSVV